MPVPAGSPSEEPNPTTCPEVLRALLRTSRTARSGAEGSDHRHGKLTSRFEKFGFHTAVAESEASAGTAETER